MLRVLQDACQILIERLEPLRTDNPNISWKELVTNFQFIVYIYICFVREINTTSDNKSDCLIISITRL